MERDPLKDFSLIEDPLEGHLGDLGSYGNVYPENKPERETFWTKIKRILTLGFRK